MITTNDHTESPKDEQESAHPSRPMRRDAQRNHQLVVEAARDVLSEFGDDATMELIAARGGVGVGTVYRRFPNKAALFDELVRIIITDLIEAARAALSTTDGNGLESFLLVLGQSFANHRGYADKMMAHANDTPNGVLRDLIADLTDQARERKLIAAEITFDDVMVTIDGLRGVIVAGPPSSSSWKRHLRIHLTGMRVHTPTESPVGQSMTTGHVLRPRQRRPLDGHTQR